MVEDGSIIACGFSPCGNYFITGSTSGELTVWDCQMKCLLNVKTAHDLGVTCCEFSTQPIKGAFYMMTFRKCFLNGEICIDIMKLLTVAHILFFIEEKYKDVLGF